MISKAVKNIGTVLEVKAETKEGFNMRSGHARVEINLQEPLQTGQLIRINNKTLWLDFRYEWLSHFCYSCGKLGHYAMSCKDIPFDEANLMERRRWLMDNGPVQKLRSIAFTGGSIMNRRIRKKLWKR